MLMKGKIRTVGYKAEEAVLMRAKMVVNSDKTYCLASFFIL